jgi:phosphopantothenoylcysteine decarboxylase/phosphopantothenate--cysteine ligase
MIDGKHILLIVSGGIAAYKALELIRLIQKAGGTVQAILTGAATEFVTPLSVSALSGNAALTELFDLTQEARIGHIELSRSADLIVIAPASADLLAKLAHGLADDLASTCLLATDTAILAAPAMNVRMWQAAATRRNIDTLTADGVKFVGPDEGPMACGEYGPGRMAEPAAILHAIEDYFGVEATQKPLADRHIVMTSGPTREPIDPVRYISNSSSGKQGAAIGSALLALGAKVTFVTGPAEASPPLGATIVRVETAIEMRDAVLAALPADAAICVAAVADWRVVGAANQKIKKGGADPVLKLAPNPDILAEVSALPRPQRPTLVVGFAAETENLVENAKAKHQRKGCDWLLANDVGPRSGVFGGDATHILFLGGSGLAVEDWGVMSKAEVGVELAERLARALS